MPWFKVDDGLHSHPKWVAATPAARALWVTAGSWCAAHLTDGYVPRHVLPMFCARPKDAGELVRLGLWIEADGDRDGWLFHDWDEFQPSSESVEAERAAARERQRRAREKARESRRASRRDSNRESRADNGASHGPPDPTRPDPTDNRGGENLQAADPDVPPPRRCSTHQNWPADATIPACGPCADARRAHTDWARRHGNGQADNHDHRLDAQQRAARARAERHLRAVNGEACPHCQDTGLTLDENNVAVPCHHPQAATP